MLNCKDVSEYLKISADGVEVSTRDSCIPGRVAQSVTRVPTDANLTADPWVAS